MPAETDRPWRSSSFTRSNTTMFASAATPIVRITPAIPGRVSVIGISLIDREQVQRVDPERDDGDRAEHAIEDEQEDRDQREAREPRDQPLVERLAAERRRHLRTRHQLQPHRQRPDLQDLRQVLGRVDRERTRDRGARPAVDPVRVLDVVDRGRRDELVVEHDREMLRDRRPERVVASALGDRARDLLERFAPAVGELEPDDRRVAELLVEVLLRIADVGARQRRVVLHHPEAVGVRSVRAHLLVAHHQDAFRDLHHLGALALGSVEVLERRLPRVRRPALAQRTLGIPIERIEPRPVGGAVVAVTLRFAPRGLPHRLEEPRDRPLLIGVLIGIGPAVPPEQIGFPVVEEQLRRRPHLLSRPLGVLDARQIDLDLVPTGLQQLRLGHAERVHPLAHDVHRPLQRLRRDRRLLRRRLGLVHQLHATLQIQPQRGLALIEHRQRRGDQPRHEEQDEPGASALGHAAGRRRPPQLVLVDVPIAPVHARPFRTPRGPIASRPCDGAMRGDEQIGKDPTRGGVVVGYGRQPPRSARHATL